MPTICVAGVHGECGGVHMVHTQAGKEFERNTN